MYLTYHGIEQSWVSFCPLNGAEYIFGEPCAIVQTCFLGFKNRGLGTKISIVHFTFGKEKGFDSNSDVLKVT